MILEIVKHPHDVLRKVTTDLTLDVLCTKETQDLIDNMIDTMHKADGVGIAAPQVGSELRMTIIGKVANKRKLKDDLPLVNPSWQPLSKKFTIEEEGCLSIPKTWGKVKRYKDIRVTALDREGNAIEFDASGFYARVIQHEVDHLNGVLFIDKATDIYTTE